MDDLIYNRASSDVTNKTTIGYYNYNDLNRIEEWTEFVYNELTNAGYNIPAQTQKTDWDEYDKPTEANMERIRTNIKTLMTNYTYQSAMYSNLKKMNYVKANRVEKILYELNDMYESMCNMYVYCGVANMGEPLFWQNQFIRMY